MSTKTETQKTADSQGQALEKTEFPTCYRQCNTAHYYGVNECVSSCPHKFNSAGRPLAINNK